MRDKLESFLIALIEYRTRIKSHFYCKFMPTLFENRIKLFYFLNNSCTSLGYSSLILLLYGVFFWKPAGVTSSGLCLDIVGAITLFLNEEWERTLEFYKDEKAYPYGPPSHVTRVYFDFESPESYLPLDVQSDENTIQVASYFHWIRGIAFLVLGFVLQLLSAWM